MYAARIDDRLRRMDRNNARYSGSRDRPNHSAGGLLRGWDSRHGTGSRQTGRHTHSSRRLQRERRG